MIDNIINDFIHLPGWYFTVLTGLFGGFIGLCWYAIHSYLDASKQFRNIIYAEFEGLYPTPSKWPTDTVNIAPILKEKFPRIEIAVHKFRGHLICCIRKGFDAAWLQYHKNYEQYMPFISTSIVNGKQITVDTCTVSEFSTEKLK